MISKPDELSVARGAGVDGAHLNPDELLQDSGLHPGHISSRESHLPARGTWEAVSHTAPPAHTVLFFCLMFLRRLPEWPSR